jgi:hypothetical protein
MGKPTGADRQPAQEKVDQWLLSYRPQGVDADCWHHVRPFVLQLASQLGLTEVASAARVVRALARLGGWCVKEGLPLDVELVLDPDTVERFVSLGLRDNRSRATYRAVLRHIGPLLTRHAPWEPRPAIVARRQVAKPYAPFEVDILRIDAEQQPTYRRGHAARALLALGMGAGLDGRWVARVAATDVVERDGVVLVRVGQPSPREVPVLAEWEGEVLQIASSAGDEFLVGGRSMSRNRAGALAASLAVPLGHPRLSSSRLRSTWLVHHMTAGTRLPELAAAAGLAGVTVLSDLLSFVPAAAPEDAHRMLRGVLS